MKGIIWCQIFPILNIEKQSHQNQKEDNIIRIKEKNNFKTSTHFCVGLLSTKQTLWKS